MSDFIHDTFHALQEPQLLLLNMHPSDINPLAAILAAITTPGLGRAITYSVLPQPDLRLRLSSGKPSAAKVRAGWVPEPVVCRFRTLPRALRKATISN